MATAEQVVGIPVADAAGQLERMLGRRQAFDIGLDAEFPLARKLDAAAAAWAASASRLAVRRLAGCAVDSFRCSLDGKALIDQANGMTCKARAANPSGLS